MRKYNVNVSCAEKRSAPLAGEGVGCDVESAAGPD